MTLTLFDLAGITLEVQPKPARPIKAPGSPRRKPVAPLAEGVRTITDDQKRTIAQLLVERPDRVELILIVLKEMPVEARAYAYTNYYLKARKQHLDGIARGEAEALAEGRAHSMEQSIPSLYLLFRQPDKCGTMRRTDAARFIQWLKYEKPVRESFSVRRVEEDFMLHYPTKLPVWGRTL